MDGSPGLQGADATDTVSGRPLEGLVLPMSGSPIRASAAKVDAAAAEVTAILSAPLVLNAAGTPVEVPITAIAAASSIAPAAADGFTVTVNGAALRASVEAAVRASVGAAVQDTEAAPADATIVIVNDAPTVNPAVPGRTGRLGRHRRRHPGVAALAGSYRAGQLCGHPAVADHRACAGSASTRPSASSPPAASPPRRGEHQGGSREGERRHRAAGYDVRAQ